MWQRRFHRKMGPLLGGLPVSVVPNATVKRRDILVLCFYFLLNLKPDTDPARVPLLDEYLQGFLQQLFSRSAVQGRARDASSAWCCVRFFPPNSHRWLSPQPLSASHAGVAADEQ